MGTEQIHQYHALEFQNSFLWLFLMFVDFSKGLQVEQSSNFVPNTTKISDCKFRLEEIGLWTLDENLSNFRNIGVNF